MTVHEPSNPHSAEHDIPDTEVISVATPAPVFVDTTGRRSRLLRRLAYAFGALVMVYGGLISVSLAGGPVRSSAVLPLPGLAEKLDDEAKPHPEPTPAPTPSQPPTATYATDALPRRTAGPRPVAPRVESTRASSSPATNRPPVTRTTPPKPVTTTTKPTESTTTPPATGPVTTAPTTTPPVAPDKPVAPEPPAGDSGGQGGGTPVETTSTTAPVTESGSVEKPADKPVAIDEAATAPATSAGSPAAPEASA